jgi:hypothetical protein
MTQIVTKLNKNKSTMKQKTIYKSTFMVTVLHEEPNYHPSSLKNIHYDIDEGDKVGQFVKVGELAKVGGEAVDECMDVGTDYEFFGMGGDGNELDED